MPSRAQALERMLATRPADARLLFGLALEYLKEERLEEGVGTLERYLAVADDEGNAWGRLGAALRRLGREDEARAAYARGVEAAERHGHPSLAEELRAELP
jgi:Flp pilus assembly protein TadD